MAVITHKTNRARPASPKKPKRAAKKAGKPVTPPRDLGQALRNLTPTEDEFAAYCDQNPIPAEVWQQEDDPRKPR